MKPVAFLVCALVGGIAGGLIAPLLQSDKPVGVRQARSTPDTDQAEQIEDLTRRMDALERQDRTPPPRADTMPPVRPGNGGGQPKPSLAGDGGKKGPVVIPESVRKRVDALIGKEMTHDVANRLFGWLSLNKDRIVATVAALEKAVKENPNDPELQVAYATAVTAQLANLTIQGPQQGILWAKASAAYNAAIKVKPEHWQARFGKAFGTSMAPEFLGLKPVAIKQFEKLREIQERQAPAKHHIQTYHRLGTLYKNMGNAEKAREIWDHGLRLFPDSGVLKGALEASTKR